MEINMSGVAIIVSVVCALLSYIASVNHGDKAALKASRKLHEEDMKKARLTALRSLLNEVKRIQKAVDHNSELERGMIRSVVRLPVTAFETAFVSGKPGLDASDKLLYTITDYLTLANSINSLIDIYLFSVAGAGVKQGQIKPGGVVGQIIQACKKREDQVSLFKILQQLEICLQEEIQRAV